MQNDKKRKIMILGAGEYQVPIIEKAKSEGLYTIVVSPEGPYPGLDIADKVFFYDVKDQENILKAAKGECIDGITTDQTDIPIRTVAYIAEQMKLPGIGTDAARLFTDKFLMREKCRETGLHTLKYDLVGSIEEAKHFTKHVGYPVVMKPVDNQGSRGVFRINNNDDLKKYFTRSIKYSLSGGIIIEECIEGDEFVVESVIYEKIYHDLTVGDTHHFNLKHSFIPKRRLFPSVKDPAVIRKLAEIDKTIIEAFGLNRGLTHGEYIADKKSGKIYLIEIGARGGGVNISSHIVPALTRFDSEKFLLDISLGKDVIFSVTEISDSVAGYIAFYLPEGEIVDLEGVDEINEIKSVIKHNLNRLKVGQSIHAIEDKTSRKTIIVTARTRAELFKAIKKIEKTLTIKIKTKRGYAYPIWN